MAKAGLISDLSLKLNASYQSHSKSEETVERRLNKSDIIETSKIIRDIGVTKDIDIIVTAERVILRHEAQFYGADNPLALKSLNEAIRELDRASETLAVVQDKSLYQIANKTHSVKDKDRINGLPKDAFHVFSNSHKTRLSNRIRAIEVSVEERLLLKERHNNMQVAQKEYMELQAKALDIYLL